MSDWAPDLEPEDEELLDLAWAKVRAEDEKKTVDWRRNPPKESK